MKITLSRQATVTWDGRHYHYDPHTTYDLPKETVSRLCAIDTEAIVGEQPDVSGAEVPMTKPSADAESPALSEAGTPDMETSHSTSVDEESDSSTGGESESTEDAAPSSAPKPKRTRKRANKTQKPTRNPRKKTTRHK